MIGPTAGYLFGFVAAAFVTGWLSERGWDRSLFVLVGVAPFIAASLIKNALGATLVPAIRRIVGPRDEI